MMVFARTARPIGGVMVSTPIINRDFTRDTEPQRIEFTATLLDTQNQVHRRHRAVGNQSDRPAGRRAL